MSICQYANMSKLGQTWDQSRASAVCPLSNRQRHGMIGHPGRKFDQYHPPSAEVKDEWRYVSAPSIRLHGVDTAALVSP